MRKVSDKTLLKQTNERLAALAAEVVRVEKQLKDTALAKDSWYKSYSEAQAEIKQVHALLDTLKDAPAHQFKIPDDSYCSTVELSLLTRLAAFFANSSLGQQKPCKCKNAEKERD